MIKGFWNAFNCELDYTEDDQYFYCVRCFADLHLDQVDGLDMEELVQALQDKSQTIACANHGYLNYYTNTLDGSVDEFHTEQAVRYLQEHSEEDHYWVHCDECHQEALHCFVRASDDA